MEVLMSGSKMRLNEKNVINFAACNSPVDKEGWLLKKTPDSSARGFQKRYFALKGNLLFYYDKKGDREPLGVIIMEGCTVELVEVPDQAYTFGIIFQGQGSRAYLLAADDQDTMEAWMKVLACATYEYMRLMVAELQRQLDDINAQERQKAKELRLAAAKPDGRKLIPATDSLLNNNSPSPRTESSLSSRTESSLEEDDIFRGASPATPLTESPLTNTPSATRKPNQSSPNKVVSDVLATTAPSPLHRRAPSPSQLNPVGATVVMDINDICLPSSRGSLVNTEISDMHIVDTGRLSSSKGTSSPRSFLEMHNQFGQSIVQQIQSRKSSSSALSNASSEEYY